MDRIVIPQLKLLGKQRGKANPNVAVPTKTYDQLLALKKATGQTMAAIVAMLVDRAVAGK